MITLVVLFAAFAITLFIQYIIRKRTNINLAGRIAMACMLLFTGIGHFAFTKGMSMMLPDFVPYKELLVLATGVLELAGAVGLLIPATQRITSLMIIIFFILILPSNIYASVHHINYQTASYDGKGPEYLWIRIPMQVIFIFWVWYFGYRKK